MPQQSIRNKWAKLIMDNITKIAIIVFIVALMVGILMGWGDELTIERELATFPSPRLDLGANVKLLKPSYALIEETDAYYLFERIIEEKWITH